MRPPIPFLKDQIYFKKRVFVPNPIPILTENRHIGVKTDAIPTDAKKSIPLLGSRLLCALS
jgi:hypothetical protein